jgi:hypothetical protein
MSRRQKLKFSPFSKSKTSDQQQEQSGCRVFRACRCGATMPSSPMSANHWRSLLCSPAISIAMRFRCSVSRFPDLAPRCFHSLDLEESQEPSLSARRRVGQCSGIERSAFASCQVRLEPRVSSRQNRQATAVYNQSVVRSVTRAVTVPFENIRCNCDCHHGVRNRQYRSMFHAFSALIAGFCLILQGLLRRCTCPTFFERGISRMTAE